MTDNYIRVRVNGDQNLSNTIQPVLLTENCGSFIKGRLEGLRQ